MKAICPPDYHHSNIVATEALGHGIYGYALLVLMCRKRQQKLVTAA